MDRRAFLKGLGIILPAFYVPKKYFWFPGNPVVKRPDWDDHELHTRISYENARNIARELEELQEGQYVVYVTPKTWANLMRDQ